MNYNLNDMNQQQTNMMILINKSTSLHFLFCDLQMFETFHQIYIKKVNES